MGQNAAILLRITARNLLVEVKPIFAGFYKEIFLSTYIVSIIAPFSHYAVMKKAKSLNTCSISIPLRNSFTVVSLLPKVAEKFYQSP